MISDSEMNHLKVVDQASFEVYINRFNSGDYSAFDDYFSDDVRMQNGSMVLHGVEEVKHHYNKIWESMDETVLVKNFIFNAKGIAVELHTHFVVKENKCNSPFGKLSKGDEFDYRGVVMYQFDRGGRFKDIKVSYLEFTHTSNGEVKSIGMPH